MTVKVRKVGNSYTLTIPAEAMEYLHLVNGQELEVRFNGRILEYHTLLSVPDEIDWSEYDSPSADFTKGEDPDHYIRRLRDNDRM